MNENFKAGDKVVCNDNGGMQKFLAVGKHYDVRGFSSGYLLVVQDNGTEGKCFTYRFELVKEPVTNGVDAEGKAIFFSQDMLKPFMRVERNEGSIGVFIGPIGSNSSCCVGDFYNGCTWQSAFNMDNEDFSGASAIYAPPYNTGSILDVQSKGDLIWKRTPPKTSEQLAQEAALAARNKAIVDAQSTVEEAEKALNVAQQKLNELKGL